MKWRFCHSETRALFGLLALFSGVIALAAPLSAEEQFQRALARSAAGDYAGAAAALEELGKGQPDSGYAVDALFEAAVLAEEHLQDPARAARLYEEVAERYPQSRLARRARGRADFLQRSLKTGAGPLSEYQEILRQFPHRPALESATRMLELLDKTPDFVLADRARYWLGTVYAEAKQPDAAAAQFRKVEQYFPTSEWAFRAQKARGDLAFARGRLTEAKEIYRTLEEKGDREGKLAAQEGLRAVHTAWVRRALLIVSGLYAALYLLIRIARLVGRKGALRPTNAVLYYAPIALLFMFVSASENGAIGLATSGIAIGGGLVVWLSSAESAAYPSISSARRLWRITGAGLAVLACCFVAIQLCGLTDLVLETLRSGPER